MSKGIYQVAINAYVTFRGEADCEEEYVDRIFDQFRDWLDQHSDVVDIETKIDYSRELFERPSLRNE